MIQLPQFRDDTPNNPLLSCRYNERLVLHLIRRNKSASKASLARTSGLTAAAIGGIIASLEKKGLVEIAGKIQGDMGQPATLFQLAPEGAFGLGVSINRGSIETLITNFIGEKVAARKHDIILPEPETTMEMVVEDIQQLQQQMAGEHIERIAGLGVACPSHLGTWHMDRVSSRWQSYDLIQQLKTRVGLPVYKENDANAATLAELVYGLGQTHSDFIYLFYGTIVTSLGGGIVLGEECRNGFTGNAGDIGLMPCPPGNIPSSQPEENGASFLSTRASLRSLVRYLSHCGAKIDTREDFTEALASYATQTQEWLNDCVSALEMALQGVQAVLDVPVIIFDCEEQDKPIIKNIAEKLTDRFAHAAKINRPMPEIVIGTQGGEAAAIGAATLPLDHHFSLKSEQR